MLCFWIVTLVPKFAAKASTLHFWLSLVSSTLFLLSSVFFFAVIFSVAKRTNRLLPPRWLSWAIRSTKTTVATAMKSLTSRSRSRLSSPKRASINPNTRPDDGYALVVVRND